MLYPVKNKSGKVSIQDLTRRKAITWLCWQCPHYVGPDPITGITPRCSKPSCKLYQFQPGTEGGPQHRADLRERALRWFCIDCKRTAQNKLANYQDIVNCPERTCAAFPFRLQNQVDTSVKIEDGEASFLDGDPIPDPVNDVMPTAAKPVTAEPPAEPPAEPEFTLDDLLKHFAPVAPGIEVGLHEQRVIR